jgi:hypothetical protein
MESTGCMIDTTNADSEDRGPLVRIARPSGSAFLVVLILAYSAPVAAFAEHTGNLWMHLMALGCGSLLAVLGVGDYTSPRGLWRSGAVLLGGFATIVAALTEAGLLQRRGLTMAFSWAPAVIVAGVRPVVEVFRQERARPRLDGTDVFLVTAGTWVVSAGLVALLYDGRVTGASTLVAGSTLVLYGLARERARLRWLREVAEGKHDLWRLDEHGEGSPLLDAEGATATDYHLLLIHRATPRGGYREAEAQSTTLGALARIPGWPSRGAKLAGWTVATIVSTTAVLVTLGSCALASPAAAVVLTLVLGAGAVTAVLFSAAKTKK